MSIDILQEFSTNATKERNGSWVEYSGDTKFLIARSRGTQYRRLASQRYSQFKAILDVKPTSARERLDAAEQKENEIMVEVLAKTVLLDWAGVAIGGVDTEYSQAAATKLLNVKDFREWVEAQAADIANFKDEEAAADEKK